MNIHIATESEVEPLAGMLYRAFHDKPFFTWCFEGVIHTHLERHFESGLRNMVAHQTARSTDGLEGLAAWEHTFAGGPSRFKMDPRGKPNRYLDAIHEIHARRPRQAHAYLDMLAVDPVHQGKGIARALLAPLMAQADRQHMPIYLETDSEQNVAFYKHLGFQVITSFTAAGGPLMWAMDYRPPAG